MRDYTLYHRFHDNEDLRRRVTRDLARTVNNLVSTATPTEEKTIVTRNDSVGILIKTQKSGPIPGSNVNVVRVFGTIENRSLVKRISEYSCTLSVPKCCLSFNDGVHAAEIKSSEPDYRKFRFTEGAASFIGTSVRQMRTLVYKGEIQPIPLGKKHLFLVDDLRAFVKTRRAAA